MLCISDAGSYKPTSYIISNSNERISSVDSMKFLGFTFNNDPNVREHIRLLIRKFTALEKK